MQSDTSPRLRQHIRREPEVLESIIEADVDGVRTPRLPSSPRAGSLSLSPNTSFSSSSALPPDLQPSHRSMIFDIGMEEREEEEDDKGVFGVKGDRYAGLGSILLPLILGVLFLVTLCTLASQTVAHDRADVKFMGWGMGGDGKRHWRVRRLADIHPYESAGGHGDRALRTRGDVHDYQGSHVADARNGDTLAGVDLIGVD